MNFKRNWNKYETNLKQIWSKFETNWKKAWELKQTENKDMLNEANLSQFCCKLTAFCIWWNSS